MAAVVLHDQTNILPRGRLLIVFGTLASAFLFAYADQNGVAVALPTIARDLNAENTISWAGTSSMIANTVFQVLYGRLSDIFGRRVVYLSAVLLLAVADILCATAQTSWALFLFRGLAGVATGGINSLTMMIVSDIVTLQERGRYQGILGSCIGLGNTLGPFLSAAFTEKATWRGFFYLISPLMVCSFAGSFFLLPSNMPKGKGLERAKLIDIWGLVTGTIAIMCILIAISGGGSYFAWSSPLVISLLTIGGVSAVAFIFVEAKVSRLPMVPLPMFKTPAVSAILIQNLLFGYCYYAELYFLPIYFQNVRGVSPVVSAALLTPMVIAQMIFSVGSGFYISHFSRYGEVIWAGFICWTLGASLLCLFEQGTSLAVIIIALIILGSGVGNVFQPCLVAIQAHSPKDLRAVVISNRNFFRAVGGAMGLACCSLVQQTTLRRALPEDLRYLSHYSYSLPAMSSFSADEQHQIRGAYAHASHIVFVSMAPIMGLCLLLCPLIKDRGLQRKEEAAQAPAPVPAPAPVSAPQLPPVEKTLSNHTSSSDRTGSEATLAPCQDVEKVISRDASPATTPADSSASSVSGGSLYKAKL